MLCWRYQSLARGLQSVLTCRFRMSNPLDFNDPFESAYPIICNNEGEELKDSEFANVLRSLQIGVTRVVSLTNDNGLTPGGDLLLWSHYADFGRGVRIGVELSGLNYELLQMKYTQNRPKLSSEECSKVRFAPVANQIYGVKGEMWSYENEVRILGRLNLLGNGMDVSNTRDVFCNIPAQHFLYIDFGPKIPYETCLSNAIIVLRRKKFQHIRFRRAIMDRHQFQYLYEDMGVQGIMV